MKMRTTMAAAVIGFGGMGVLTAPASADGFAITSEVPTLAELDSQIRLLVGSPASDEEKADQLEGGSAAVVVPQTVYRLGLFRAPRGTSKVTGPETHSADRHSAVINATTQGLPTIKVTITWKRIDGQWKLANESLCKGIGAVGLPIPCNFG